MRRTIFHRWALTLCLAAAVSSAQAQLRRIRIAAPDDAAPAPIQAAALDTDPDVTSLLRKAQEYIADKKYREACLVLQHLIDTARNVVTSADEQHYVPVRRQIESILAGLPPEGLAAYAQTADGEAQGLLAAARFGQAILLAQQTP